MQIRVFCEDCKFTSIAKVEWIHPKFQFMKVAGRLIEETTCEATERILLCNSKNSLRLGSVFYTIHYAVSLIA